MDSPVSPQGNQQKGRFELLIEGKFVLKAPVQRVWEHLLDPEILASSIPGVESVRVIDEKNYECAVKQKVGPISAKLRFTITIKEAEPPKHLKAMGRGGDENKAGTFTLETVVDLNELGGNEVEISYSANVSLVGRLATFGERIMRAKARAVNEEFTRNLREKLAAKTTKQDNRNE